MNESVESVAGDVLSASRVTMLLKKSYLDGSNTKSKGTILISTTMAKQIFINLSVKDVNRSMEFYTEMGFGNNSYPQF